MSEFVVMKNVKKTYKMGEVMIHAVDGVDIEIHKGEFAVIVGPSGAGKTTVLNMLGGMDRVTSGKVIVDGRDISLYNSRQLTKYRRDDIGFVFQFYNLIQNLNALENVELALQISKHPMDAKEVLKDVGLEDRMYNFPSQLSGGEQQRVAIARALAKNPKLLLCDEPTGALNRAASTEVMDALGKLNREGTTIMMVTHDAKVASRCKRVLYILDGTIKGEYKAPEDENLSEADRERRLQSWLLDLGW